MSIEVTRQLQGDEVVSKTDADETYLTLTTSQTVSGEKSFDSNIHLLNRNRLILRKDTTSNTFNIYIGSDNKCYAEARDTDLILSGNTIGVNNKKIVNLATPTANDHAANKQYVDNKVNNLVTIDTAQTITAVKKFNENVEILTDKRLFFRGERDWNINSYQGFLNIGDAWGIIFNQNRGANDTATLQNHIETPYINIGSGNNGRYRLAKSGDNLTWDGKIVVTQSQLYNMFSSFAIACGVENSVRVRSILEELGEE